MKRLVGLLLLCVCSVLSPGILMAEEGDVYYIQAPRAAVLASPSLDSQVLGELFRGQKFIGVSRGNWLRLSYKGSDGYLPAILAAAHAPLVKRDFESKTPQRHHLKTRISSFPPEAAGEKNRRETPPEGDTGGNRPDYEALRVMESFAPSQEEIQKFMEGR